MLPINARRNITVSSILLLLASVSVRATQDDPSKEETKRFNATKRALQTLVGVAELRTGVTDLTFNIDADRSWPSNHSSVCPIQGKTRLEALRAAGRSDVETEVLQLHHAADFDRSGFVSDEEAERFGALVQFGQQVDYLVMKTGGNATERLANLMRLNRVEFRTRVHDYKKFIGRAKKVGVNFPEARSIN